MSTGFMNINNTSDFLEIYKELEIILRKKYGIHESESIRQLFYKKQELKKFNTNLNFLADVRNLYSHFQIKRLNKYMNVKDSVFSTINSIKQIISKEERVFDNCIKLNHLFYANIDDNVYKKIKIMNDKDINSIPILNDGVVIGLFKEDTLLELLQKDNEIMLDEGISFREIEKYLKIDSKVNIYVDPNYPIADLYNRYYDSFISGNPISYIFITESGDSDGKLMGIITQYRISTYNI